MPYTLRKPIGPVENQMLRKALDMLHAVDSKIQHVRFVLLRELPVTKSFGDVPPSHNDGAPTYTVDRSPVGEVQGTPVLVITLGNKPVLLISPWYQMIVEKEG